MNDHDARHHDLLFLLGLAPLALGCSVGVPDNGSSFTSNPYGGNGTSSMDSAGDTEGTSEGSGAVDGTSGASASASASATITVSAGDSVTVSASAGSSGDGNASVSASATFTTGDDSMTGPPPPGSACEAYGYLLAGCYAGGDPAAATMYTAICEEYAAYLEMYYGPACGAAFEEFATCISQLQCQDLPSIGMPGYCDVQLAAAQGVCV